MANFKVTGTASGLGKKTLIKSSTGGANNIGTATIAHLSNYNSILVTYKYGSSTGNVVCNLYPVGLLKEMSSETKLGETGNYHSIAFTVSYSSSNDTLTMVYQSNSRAYDVCIYGIN